MKKFTLTALSAGIAMTAMVSTGAFAGPTTKGNGLPKIPMNDAFSLNIHAYADCPSGDFDGSNRRTIVVKSTNVDAAHTAHMNGTDDSSIYNDIWLSPGGTDEFQVLDGNACDSGVDDGGADKGAQLILPSIVASNYDVYVKFIGKPGTKLDPVLCGEGVFGGVTTTICHSGTTINTRETGPGETKFQNYTKQLMGFQDVLNVCGGNVCDLFESALFSYFWDWSASDGAKAQLIFVPCSDPKAGPDPSTITCGGAAATYPTN